jgi:hypothetical protein
VPEGPYRYRPEVIEQLWRHGIHPTPESDPQMVRSYVRDLYKYEIRRLRERYLRREFSKSKYYDLVDALRRQYPVLALLPREFVE